MPSEIVNFAATLLEQYILSTEDIEQAQPTIYHTYHRKL